MFIIDISSWWIFPLMYMMFPSPYLLINFGWMCILLNIRMAASAYISSQKIGFLGKIFSRPLFWGNVYSSCCSVFLACNRMMDPVNASTLLACVFLLRNLLSTDVEEDKWPMSVNSCSVDVGSGSVPGWVSLLVLLAWNYLFLVLSW